MYKVFIVDDEASMRAGIRNNINWDNSPFTLAGEASDGETALPLMQDIMPDILITDIKMPFMDGIELSTRARKIMPWLKIILLSGHGEFAYAKQAIAIGIEEYLLKPVTSAMLLESLNKVAARIKEEKEKRSSVEKLLEGNKKVQVERLLSDLLYGSIDIDNALNLAGELGLSLVGDCYLVMCIELRASPQKGYNCYFNACGCAMGVLERWEDTISFNQGSDRVMCVLKGTDPATLEENAYAYAQAVKYEVERNGPCSVAVAIGSIVSDIGEWPKSLAEADMAKRYLHLTNKNQIISMQDISAGGLIPFKEINMLPTVDKLRYLSKSSIPEFLEETLNDFNNTSIASFLFMNYVVVDIMMAASKIIEELGGDVNQVLAGSDVSSLLHHNASVENMKEMLTGYLEKTVDFRDTLTDYKYSDVITKAKEYIQKHYSEQSISLHSVAKEVNISPNHFSTIFSQGTGETFINHLTRIRLEHAKVLLETTKMRTSDIGYEVGYNDTHYFSYVFKKNLGITPREFRNRKTLEAVAVEQAVPVGAETGGLKFS